MNDSPTVPKNRLPELEERWERTIGKLQLWSLSLRQLAEREQQIDLFKEDLMDYVVQNPGTGSNPDASPEEQFNELLTRITGSTQA